jgi:hypothetical protein
MARQLRAHGWEACAGLLRVVGRRRSSATVVAPVPTARAPPLSTKSQVRSPADGRDGCTGASCTHLRQAPLPDCEALLSPSVVCLPFGPFHAAQVAVDELGAVLLALAANLKAAAPRGWLRGYHRPGVGPGHVLGEAGGGAGRARATRPRGRQAGRPAQRQRQIEQLLTDEARPRASFVGAWPGESLQVRGAATLCGGAQPTFPCS